LWKDLRNGGITFKEQSMKWWFRVQTDHKSLTYFTTTKESRKDDK
jgi:hypothetical protein